MGEGWLILLSHRLSFSPIHKSTNRQCKAYMCLQKWIAPHTWRLWSEPIGNTRSELLCWVLGNEKQGRAAPLILLLLRYCWGCDYKSNLFRDFSLSHHNWVIKDDKASQTLNFCATVWAQLPKITCMNTVVMTVVSRDNICQGTLWGSALW